MQLDQKRTKGGCLLRGLGALHCALLDRRRGQLVGNRLTEGGGVHSPGKSLSLIGSIGAVALALVAPVLVTRKLPRLVWMMAMPPTVASELPAVGTVTVRPLTAAETDARGWPVLDGEVGLPPQPAAPPIASNPTALLQHAQNSRRV